ncbi:peptidoglycan-binding protein [Halomonas alkaliantarctica]|uniref:Peptidoglycan-binding protein n=1 Tax=Halomonas alkaliantarctica TaxID=232346 RepID=A0ABY8LNM8_9GAMM|nr:peptidoglycan-binding protein [Halomonas alkaliantarctica]WGI26018.1 peptidoglycan-binding protein [Halomonas alkaliantarctica]
MAAKQHPYRGALSGLLLSAVMLMSIDADAWERDQAVIKLSPQVRTLPHREAIEPIALEEAQAFLREHRVVDDAEALQGLAYVVAGDDRRLISGAGDRLYVRGDVPRYGQLGIYRQSEPYLAMDGTPLGLELISVGIARHISSEGEIAQLEVVSSHQEVRVNDIILPLEERELSREFMPRAPLNAVAGHVIAVPGGVRFIGRFQIVALDLGTLDGLQAGHVLRVNQQGELINDPRTQELVQLPSTEAGSVMVFKPYDRVSYALVMQASRVLEVGDEVASATN